MTWTVPGDSWRDLNTIEIRFGEKGSLLWLVFEEATRTFRLRNPATGEFGRAAEPGSRTVLSTGGAKLHLSETAVIAAGPASPEVTLLLTLEFEPPAIGEEHSVEIAATSDEGVIQDFAHVGTLTILPKHKL